MIFSISGHSGALILFLTLVYLFAIFGGVSRSQKIEPEHPLTSSKSYLIFYDVTPFIGGVAGATATIYAQDAFELVISAATGTLCSTFVVWILFDPAISLAETLLPASRKNRKERITKTKELQKKMKKKNERLMAELAETESINRKHREIELRDKAADLARLLAEYKIGCGNVEAEAVEIGGYAWQNGGIDCMRQLLEMTQKEYMERYNETVPNNYIDIWWDGIGSWRRSN